ncbi:MAG TPA: protein kinase [Gemmataceae bacterium]|nr:protein kinase [Gemmataceae bacterium]
MNPLLKYLHALADDPSLQRHVELLEEFRKNHPDVYPRLEAMYRKAQSPPPSPPPTEPAPWRVIGDYDLEQQELGRGEQGIVYKARQRSLNRIVALKELKGALFASVGVKQAFLQEAGRASQLSHPAIVPIYDADEVNGQYYYTMRLIPGRSLKEAVADGPFDPKRATRLVQRLAQAVHSAHQDGIIHCDIKPGNVLLDEGGHAWITDFGVARQLGAGQGNPVGGSPLYMAPEQLQEQVAAIGPQTDVYALGLVLTELLCGKPDRDGPPDHLPKDLRYICLACLRKGRVEYATADELAEDLQRYLDHREVRARSAPLRERLGRWVYYHPGSAVLVGLLLAATIAILVVLGVSNSRIRRYAGELQQRNEDLETTKQQLQQTNNDLEKRGQELQQSNDNLKSTKQQLQQSNDNLNMALETSQRNERLARERAIKSRRISAVLIDSLQVTDWLGKNFPAIPRSDGRPTPRAGLLVEARESARRELANYPLECGHVLLVVGNALRGIGNYEAAEDTLAEAEQALQNAADATPVDQFRLLYCRASLWHDMGDLGTADKTFSTLLKTPPEKCENGELADAHFRFAWLSADRALLSRKSADRTRAFLVRAAEHVRTARSRYNAVSSRAERELKLAVCDLLEAVIEAESPGKGVSTKISVLLALSRLPIQDELGTALKLYYMAEKARKDGRLPEAIDHLTQLDKHAVKFAGPEHPLRGLVLGSLAGLERDAGRWEAAEAHIRQALEIGRKWAPHHPRMVEGLRELARFYRDRKNNWGEAVSLFEEAIVIAKRHPEDLPGEVESLFIEVNEVRRRAAAGGSENRHRR